MSQPQRLGDGGIAPCQCLVRIAETEKDNPQIHLCEHLGVNPGLMDKRAVGDWIVERKDLFEMRSGRSELANKHQGSPGRRVTQNEPTGIIALTAQTQQILVEALSPVEFAAGQMIE